MGAQLSKILRMGLWLMGALALVVQPLLADGRPVNPPPASAAHVRHTSESAAHVPLADLLAHIPDSEANRAWLSYSDLNGWHETTGVPRLSTIDDLDTLSDGDNQTWLQELPPEAGLTALGPTFLLLGDMRPAYGFDFLDAAQTLEVGEPPTSLNLVTLNVPSSQVSDALVQTGYTETVAAGAVLYSLNEDYAVDVNAPSRAGQLGVLNRIAILERDAPGTEVLIARATAPIEQSLWPPPVAKAAHWRMTASTARSPARSTAASSSPARSLGWLCRMGCSKWI